VPLLMSCARFLTLKGITLITRILVRRAVLAGALMSTVAVLAACGSDGDHGAMPGMSPVTAAPASSVDPGTFNDSDVMFAQMMIPHHQQAVQMAALAPTRANDGEVKELAAHIVAAQQPEIATMTGWLSAWGKPVPTMTGGMDMGSSDMGGMGHGATMSVGPMPGMMSDADMTALTAAKGADFDRQFCKLMIAHHQGAISMAKTLLAQGANVEAKTIAQQIVTGQQAEIDTMNNILARL
jgi:uncharacterized protein (DUF305 family)